MEARDKISKSFKIYLIILIIFAIIFINPNARSGIPSIFNSFSGVEKELEIISEFDIDKDTKTLDIHGERVISWRDNNLSFLDFKGSEVLKKDLTFKEPDMVVGEEVLYLMDKSSGHIYLLNKAGDTLERINLKSPFYGLQEKDGKIIIYRGDDDANIDIIDQSGDLLRTHKENIPILTADIKDRKQDYLISTLDMDKGLKSIATIYSSSGEELMSLDIKDEIIVYSKFIKDNLLIATEKSLYFIENNKIKWEKKYDGLKDIKLIDKDILVLYNNKFQVINLRGKVRKEIVLTKALENILATKDDIFIYGKNHIIIPETNKNILNFKTEEKIINLRYDGGNLLVGKEGKVEIYKIKKKGDK